MAEQTESKTSSTEDRNEDCDLVEQTDSNKPSTEDRNEDCGLVEQTDSNKPSTEDGKEDYGLVQPTKFLLTSSSKDIDEDLDFTVKFDQNTVLMILENLVKTKTRRSTIEILLILHHCFNNSCVKNGCNLNDILFPYKKIRKIFTLMNRILWFILNNDSEKLVTVNTSVSDFKIDYKLNLVTILNCRLRIAHKFVETKDVISPKIKKKLLPTFKKFNHLNMIIWARYGWNCMKKFRQCENTTPVNHVNQEFQMDFFKYYQANARIGRLPHVFWQDAPFEKKIKNNNSLEEIFLIGDEEKCSVCYMDGEDFRNDFAIFLNCNHLICVSCAEWLIIMEYDNITQRRCPVCRTEIQAWTTKKLAQLTLDEQSRKEEISLVKPENASQNKQRQTEKDSWDETRQEDENFMEEQKQLEDVSLDKHSQQEVASPDEQRQQEVASLDEQRQQKEPSLDEHGQQEEPSLDEQRQHEEPSLDEHRHQEVASLDEQRQQKEPSLDEHGQQEEPSLDEQRQHEEPSLDEHRHQEVASLDEQRQQEVASLGEQRQQQEASLDEQRQQVEASLDEQIQQEEVFKTIYTDLAGLTSNKIYHELFPVDNSAHFVFCLKCLNQVKAELSCLEIILILVSNLSLACCLKRKLITHLNANDILQALNNTEHIVRYSLHKVQNAHLNMSSVGLVDRAMLHHCFFKIRSTLRQLEVFSTDTFLKHKEDIDKQLNAIIKIVCDIEHILHPADMNNITKVCDNSD